jgi:hypothetical protein
LHATLNDFESFNANQADGACTVGATVGGLEIDGNERAWLSHVRPCFKE